MLEKIKDNWGEYLQHKRWLARLVLWVLGVYIFTGVLKYKYDTMAPNFFVAIGDGFLYFVHETSHVLFGGFGTTTMLLAGSGSEIFSTAMLVVIALLTRGYFAILFCSIWFTLACIRTSEYMADSIPMSMHLTTFGGGTPIHDWNWLFTNWGVLDKSLQIAAFVRWIGVISGLVGIGFSLFVVVMIFINSRHEKHQQEVTESMNRLASKKPAEREPGKPFVSSSIYPTAERGVLNPEKPDGEKSKSSSGVSKQ